MAHLSRDSNPLSVKRLHINSWKALDVLQPVSHDVFLFHLKTEGLYPEESINEISQKLNHFFMKLANECVVGILCSVENALSLIPKIQTRLNFKLWISIIRDLPIIKFNDLPNNNIALLLFSKYDGAFKHCYTQIAYTYCPICAKTTKDYGGKKHLYSPYGTLMSDVWRDICYNYHEYPDQIIDRIRDLLGLEPYKILHYIDIRSFIIQETCDKQSVLDYDKIDMNDSHPDRLINTDCLNALKDIPNDSIDFAFADPPYNIKKKYENWDDSIHIKEYFAWCDKWLSELSRVIKPNRTVAVINIPLWVVRHYEHLKLQLQFQCWITWEGLSLPVRQIMPAHYGILCMSKGKARGAVGLTNVITKDTRYKELNTLKQWNCLRENCIKRRNVPDITDRESLADIWWDIHRLKHNSKRVDHPCQLPPQLMRRLISLYTLKNEVVLDPFNGAGTTTLIAQELGRHYIGVELSEYYHNIALQRHDDISRGIDPFAKGKPEPVAKNSRVQRLKKQKYAIPKKTLQLEVKRISEIVGRVPTREDVKMHSKYPFEYYEHYFIDWGEVCSAVGNKGMKEIHYHTEEPRYHQLKLFERKKRYIRENSEVKS